jgi:hypothetical protein
MRVKKMDRIFAAEVLFTRIEINPSRIAPPWLVQDSDATAQKPLPSENTTSFEKLLRRKNNFYCHARRAAVCRYPSTRCGTSDH